MNVIDDVFSKTTVGRNSMEGSSNRIELDYV